ncbi:MAG: hypothetical protein M3Q56_00135 [Bacteroidota bacterium]|nr:hypothetical protein [Bacteroidota bacterium]
MIQARRGSLGGYVVMTLGLTNKMQAKGYWTVKEIHERYKSTMNALEKLKTPKPQ